MAGLTMAFALSVHVLSAVVWVGGMFFAYMALRPAAVAALEGPQRLTLWARTFGRFFPWVWVAIVLLVASGLWMVRRMGGFEIVSGAIWTMAVIATLMILIFMFLYFVRYPRLRACVEAADWQNGARELARIRHLVAVNLSLGLITVVVASGGRFWP